MMTQANIIFKELEKSILSGEMRAHTVIDESEIARRFGVSRTPARDALNLLTHSGLIAKQPRKGYFVPALNIEQIIQIFEMSVNTTAFAHKLAVNRMTESERRELRELVQSSEHYVDQEDRVRYQQAAIKFHDKIIEFSRNDYIVEWSEGVKARLTPYFEFHLYDKYLMKADFEDHILMLDLIDRREAEELFTLVSRHAWVGGDVLAQYIARDRALKQENS